MKKKLSFTDSFSYIAQYNKTSILKGLDFGNVSYINIAIIN